MFIPAKYLLLMTLIYLLNSKFDPLCNNAAINMATAYIVAFFPCEAADAMESPFAQRNTVASADQRIIRIDAQTKKQISKLLLFGFFEVQEGQPDSKQYCLQLDSFHGTERYCMCALYGFCFAI